MNEYEWKRKAYFFSVQLATAKSTQKHFFFFMGQWAILPYPVVGPCKLRVMWNGLKRVEKWTHLAFFTSGPWTDPPDPPCFVILIFFLKWHAFGISYHHLIFNSLDNIVWYLIPWLTQFFFTVIIHFPWNRILTFVFYFWKKKCS